MARRRHPLASLDRVASPLARNLDPIVTQHRLGVEPLRGCGKRERWNDTVGRAKDHRDVARDAARIGRDVGKSYLRARSPGSASPPEVSIESKSPIAATTAGYRFSASASSASPSAVRRPSRAVSGLGGERIYTSCFRRTGMRAKAAVHCEVEIGFKPERDVPEIAVRPNVVEADRCVDRRKRFVSHGSRQPSYAHQPSRNSESLPHRRNDEIAVNVSRSF
jgi:hypothetical protein